KRVVADIGYVIGNVDQCARLELALGNCIDRWIHENRIDLFLREGLRLIGRRHQGNVQVLYADAAARLEGREREILHRAALVDRKPLALEVGNRADRRILAAQDPGEWLLRRADPGQGWRYQRQLAGGGDQRGGDADVSGRDAAGSERLDERGPADRHRIFDREALLLEVVDLGRPVQ